jgi:glutaredoxin
MRNKKVTLYVKSIKTIIGTEKIDRQYFSVGPPVKVSGFRMIPKQEVDSITKYGFVIPEDQNRVVEMVREFAPKHGFDVEIVDVTKENILRRVLQEEIKRIKTFPTLITDSGEKIEGNISKEQIRSLLSNGN